MKLNNPEAACELEKRVNVIDERVAKMEARVTNVENEVVAIRKEQQLGFERVTDAVNALGHDFGNRMNILDKRMVEEKEKWGGVLREIVKWTARALLIVASAAAGVNLATKFWH